MKSEFLELLPSMGFIGSMINTAIWLLSTYDGYWYRVNSLEQEIISLYCKINEEVIRP